MASKIGRSLRYIANRLCSLEFAAPNSLWVGVVAVCAIVWGRQSPLTSWAYITGLILLSVVLGISAISNLVELLVLTLSGRRPGELASFQLVERKTEAIAYAWFGLLLLVLLVPAHPDGTITKLFTVTSFVNLLVVPILGLANGYTWSKVDKKVRLEHHSRSFHLRSERASEVVELLRDAGLRGFVFPSSHGWVSFLVDKEWSLIERNPGLLLDYWYVPGQYWMVGVWERDHSQFEFYCGWPWFDDVEHKLRGEFPADALGIPSDKLDQVRQVLETPRPEFTDRGALLPLQFMRLSGIEHFEEMSYERVKRLCQERPNALPDIMEVALEAER